MSLINFPALVDTFTNIDASAGDKLNTAGKEHDARHDKVQQAVVALEEILAGPVFVNLKGKGAKGDGSTNDSSAITAALSGLPAGTRVRVPTGEYMVDPGVLQMLGKFYLEGDGGDSSIFTLRSDTGGAAMLIDVAFSSVRVSYGPRVKGIGLNLVNAPSATGFQVGASGGGGGNSGWTWLDDVRVEGGTKSLDCEAFNVKVTNFHFINPTQSFMVIHPTGQEFRAWDGIFEIGPSHTVPIGIDIPILVGGIAGAVYLRDIAINNAGTALRGIYEHCPNGSTASVPLRCENVTLDNLSGPGYDLVNVTDATVTGGWVNAAAGTTNGAIRIYGGGNHQFMGVEQMNGGSSGGCSIDFAGGTPTGITLIGNNPATGPYYRISATGKPAARSLLIMDRLLPAAAEANITNDWPALVAAMAPLWTPTTVMAPQIYGSGGTSPVVGRATLVAGTVTVACALIDSTLSDIQMNVASLGGLPGFLCIASKTTGTGFVIESRKADGTLNTGDTSTISWLHRRV